MTVFLVCEFDPLHHGHVYIMQKARELYPGCDLVCVMSGNFTQRGTPSVIDKFRRAKAAVLCGADLVLSLPFPWCSGSAEYFARGALTVISGFYNEGDALVFGSECADAEYLIQTAENLRSEPFRSALKEKIADHKMPYAEARQSLYEEIYGECPALSARNDILALEYIKAASELGADLIITPVKRELGFASSSAIRKSADPASLLPAPMRSQLLQASRAGEVPASYKNFEKAIIYHLRTYAGCAAEGGYGVAERLSKAAKDAESIEQVFKKAASSAYTDAKLRRALLFSLLGVADEDLKASPSYTQLLAADKTGLKKLSAARKESKITVITKPADAPERFDTERRADELYCMLTPKTLRCGEYIRRAPFISEE